MIVDVGAGRHIVRSSFVLDRMHLVSSPSDKIYFGDPAAYKLTLIQNGCM
jgi:hypothetical protein